MIHKICFRKNYSGVSYIVIANSTNILFTKIENILRIIHELWKCKIGNIFLQQYIIIKLEIFTKNSKQGLKGNKYNNWRTKQFNVRNKNNIKENKKKVTNILVVSITKNFDPIGIIKNSLKFKVRTLKYANNSIIDSNIKKSVDIKFILKISIKESLINNMKYQCSEKNNCSINTNRFTNIGNRDCIEKKILRPTRQTSHMNKSCTNRKTSIQYKTSKRKIRAKSIDKVEFCGNKNTCLNLKEEKVDNCKKNTPEVDASHIDTMSLFYEVVDTKNHNRTNNYDISENFLKQSIKQKPTLIVKFKKIRQSELSLLNGEAENFMFPKRFSYDKPNSVKFERSPLKRSFSSSFESTNECKQNQVDRSSRQSENSSVYNNVRNTNGSTTDTKTNFKMSDYSFSFEKIPSDETWFNVFRRQDESKEKTFEYYGSTGFRKLPYEMGPLPPLQNCRTCTLQESEHINTKIKAPSEEIALPKQSGIKKTTEIDTKTSQQIHENSSSSYKNFEMPRISPREHASTLAILSCLIKKNNEVDLLTTNGQPTQNDNIYSNSQILNLIESVKSLRKKSKSSKSHKNQNKHDTAVNGNKNCSNNKPNNLEKYVNMQKLTTELDYFLVSSFTDNTEHLIFNQNINYFSNDMNLLEMTENQYQSESLNKALCTNKYKTKRKNNRTGWPKKKKIVTRQQKIKVGDNKSKNTEFIKRISPITPPYSDSDESMQCSYLNVLDDNYQHSYFNGVEPICNTIEKKPENSDSHYTKNMDYNLDKSNETQKEINYSLEPNLKFNCSPRKLRKLRGRYRER